MRAQESDQSVATWLLLTLNIEMEIAKGLMACVVALARKKKGIIEIVIAQLQAMTASCREPVVVVVTTCGLTAAVSIFTAGASQPLLITHRGLLAHRSQNESPTCIVAQAASNGPHA